MSMSQMTRTKIDNSTCSSKNHIVEFDGYGREGKLSEIYDWCRQTFPKGSWNLDWHGLSSCKQWLFITKREDYATLFALRWG